MVPSWHTINRAAGECDSSQPQSLPPSPFSLSRRSTRMACSKLFIALVVVLATLLVVSSGVSARELAQQAGAKNNKEGVEDTKQYGGYGGYPGGGYGGYPGGGYGGYPGGGYGGYPGGGYGGYPGGGYGGYPGGGYPGRRPYCRWGCCGRGWYGGGCRCCMSPAEIPDATYLQTEP